MATKIEVYDRLRAHIPEPAARIIAEEMHTDGTIADKLQVLESGMLDVKDHVHGVELSVEKLRSSMFRSQLTFFVPLWIGVYGTLIAIVFKH